MKKSLYTLLFFGWFISADGMSQTAPVTCNQLCITNITLDSVNQGWMNIEIYFSGNNQFINYPYPAVVTDTNGDTIATGQMNFFGQVSNTSQSYPASTNLTSLPPNFTCTVEFVYDTMVCLLSYPCTPQGVNEPAFIYGASLYPNPASNHVTLVTIHPLDNADIKLFDTKGALVKTIYNANGVTHDLDVAELPKGCYIITATQNKNTILRKLLIVR